MALTKKQMEDALSSNSMSQKEKDARKEATNRAASRARTALCKAFAEDYKGLYQLALVTELAKVGLTK